MIDNSFFVNSINNIELTGRSIEAFFYQKIPQPTFTNVTLANYAIDYSVLLPSSQFIVTLNANQVTAQIQAYINLCNKLIIYITTTFEVQTTLFYEQTQNQLNDSIANLNGLALTLLAMRYATLYSYVIPYSMGFSNALFLNGIPMNEYATQASLNYDVIDFNDLSKDTVITLSKG